MPAILEQIVRRGFASEGGRGRREGWIEKLWWVEDDINLGELSETKGNLLQKV